MNDKVIVLGLDGLSWNVIQRMTDEGKLKNIQKIMEEGCAGKMNPGPPLLSPMIWTSIFTGKRPEKHGIVDFYSLGKDLKSQQIWDILDREGFKIGAYRPWSGWNVKEVDGFFVPGFFSFQTDTHPEKLEFVAQLDKKARTKDLSPTFLLKTFFKFFEILPLETVFNLFKKSISSLIPRGYREGMYRKKEVEFSIHTSLFHKLLDETNPGFSVFYDNSCDYLSHNYWKEMKSDSKFSEVIPHIYEKVDEFIGEINEFAERQGSHLLVVSDHGFEGVEDTEEQIIIDIPNLLNLLDLTEDVYGMNLVETGILRLKPDSSKKPGEIRESLKSLNCEGKQLFEVKGKGGRINFRIRDFARGKEGVKVQTPKGEVEMEEIVSFGSTKTGDHCGDNGVFMIKGPNIKESEEIGDVKPYDVTPTLLALLETPIPSDADGEVLEKIFREEPEIKYFEPEEIEKEGEDLEDEEEKLVKERLKDLGYL